MTGSPAQAPLSSDKVGCANPLALKLSTFTELSASDRNDLDELARMSVRVSAPHDLISEKDRPNHVFLLLRGWAYRYKMLRDGKRQIIAYLMPGDLCDTHVFILARMDHSIGLLGDAEVAAIPKAHMLNLVSRSNAICRALWWSSLVDEATLRHWIVNIGQRDAYTRVAHLFCELWMRADQVGLVSGGSFDLPLTQEQLGDTVGMTTVHTNRMIQRMRREGLISLEQRRLTIHKLDLLRRTAGFDPEYLHLARRQPQ